jgi:hypothetical protein
MTATISRPHPLCVEHEADFASISIDGSLEIRMHTSTIATIEPAADPSYPHRQNGPIVVSAFQEEQRDGGTGAVTFVEPAISVCQVNDRLTLTPHQARVLAEELVKYARSRSRPSTGRGLRRKISSGRSPPPTARQA